MTDVLVAGAGLGGLSTAMFLARRGIRVLVVEKHPGTSVHPRAAGQSPRTMELLRIGGVADEVRAAGHGTDGIQIKIAESVRGRVLHTIVEDFGDLDASTAPISTIGWGWASQDQVEPIMLAQAEKYGAEVRFETELVSFRQDSDGVTARLLDRKTGRSEEVRARYLVGADGNRSPVREQLGIPRTGWGMLANHVGVVFEADLSEVVTEKSLYYLQNPAFTGAYAATNVDGRHIFSIEYHPESGESFSDYTPERVTELIRIGLDAPDLKPEIVWLSPYEWAARIADRWRDGRVFLLGDAAKVTPPTGGMGGNAAVCDGYDLAWKLASVLYGEAGDGLLDTYEAERKPFAELVVNESYHNYVQRMAPHLDGDDVPELLGHMEILLGFRHRSTAVIAPDDDGSVVENPFEASGRPGFRAPLARLADDRSTVDLFGESWVLFTGPDGAEWHAAAQQAPIRVDSHDIGAATELYGIGSGGASLVRPDGVVAWRVDAGPEKDQLKAVLSTLLSC
jgi:aklavinone 12-hydroxylase